MTARRWFVTCAAVAVLVAPLFWLAPNTASTIPAGPWPVGVDRSGLAGTPSCSARGCHGAVSPAGARPLPDCLGSIDPASIPVVRQNEFSLWLARDKHAQAYQVLDGHLGRRILKNLYGEDKAKWDESVCLACHTNPLAVYADSSELLKQEQRSGVGCESCHGAAIHWLDAHTKPEWMCNNAETKRKFGMTPMSDPVALAQTCVGCHVGAPAENGHRSQDMNHDMIAAGHPRLDFELSAFLANMPPHWDEKEQAKHRDVGYDARIWAVGQVATTQAALRLLADRANGNPRPWPEFSEYNCSSCHHDLSDPSWRQKRGYANRKPGAFVWGTWYSAMPRWLASRAAFGGDGANDKAIAAGFDELEKAMAAPQNNQKELSVKAIGLVQRLIPLEAKASHSHLDKEETRKLLASLAELAPNDSTPDWDEAEQLYLAAAALSQDQGAEQSQEKLSALVKMLSQPRDYHPEEFHKVFNPSLKSLIEKH